MLTRRDGLRRRDILISERNYVKHSIQIAAAIVSIALLGLFAVGCAKTNSAGVPVSAEFRLNQAIAVTMEANKAAVEVIIAMNKNGLIDRTSTAEVLSYNYAVAQNGKTAITVMQSSATLEQKRAEVSKAFASVLDMAVLSKYLQAHKDDPRTQAVVAVVSSLQTALGILIQEVK